MNPEKTLGVLALLLLLALPSRAHSTMHRTTEYRTQRGPSFSVTESHPRGQSLSDISVGSRGVAYDTSQTLRDCAPIDKIITADLDMNGFDELYIITRSSGSGSYGDLLGFAANRNISLSPIHFPKIAEGDNRFIGYMGHDTFEVADHKLLRTFPVYLPTDHNGRPTGGRRTVRYALYAGEATWQLRIETVSQTQQFPAKIPGVVAKSGYVLSGVVPYGAAVRHRPPPPAHGQDRVNGGRLCNVLLLPQSPEAHCFFKNHFPAIKSSTAMKTTTPSLER